MYKQPGRPRRARRFARRSLHVRLRSRSAWASLRNFSVESRSADARSGSGAPDPTCSEEGEDAAEAEEAAEGEEEAGEEPEDDGEDEGEEEDEEEEEEHAEGEEEDAEEEEAADGLGDWAET